MRISTPRTVLAAAVSGAVFAVGGAATAVSSPNAASGSSASLADAAEFMRPGGSVRAALPALRVRTIVDNLDHPWDLAFLPGGEMLFTERNRGVVSWRGPNGATRVVARPADLWVSAETGLMSVAVAEDFATTRTFWTCQGADTGSGSHDVRVVRWRLHEDARGAERLGAIVSGLPTGDGRHGGCRLEFGREGALYVGTGDAQRAEVPQDKTSGGGKVLRVQRGTGAGWPSNPYPRADSAMKRRVFTYGHRNVQGLALRPDGRMWSAEHGPDRDDEVNALRAGGDYGWDPAPDYDNPGPMTDFSLPGRQIGARWSSGFPTLAVSGITWLTGERWQGYRGRLVVATLKDSSVRMMRFRGNEWQGTVVPDALDGDYGRLRTAAVGPRHALYFTTDNGGGTDHILKVTPR